MEYTSNYQLPVWAETDRILRTDFNDAYQKLDAALKTNADALDAETAARVSALAAKGNCRIYGSTYIGTGTHGTGGKNSFTFPGQPAAVLIADPVDGYLAWAVQGMQTVYAYTSQGTLLEFTWSGNTVQWFSYNTNIGQLNHQGRTYYIYALLDAEP